MGKIPSVKRPTMENQKNFKNKNLFKNFSRIALSLWELTKKNVPFVWSDACQNAFDTLKRALISVPILVFPDFTTPFYLYVHAWMLA